MTSGVNYLDYHYYSNASSLSVMYFYCIFLLFCVLLCYFMMYYCMEDCIKYLTQLIFMSAHGVKLHKFYQYMHKILQAHNTVNTLRQGLCDNIINVVVYKQNDNAF